MKERPILFSAPMVRALLDGTKTQTRRVVKNCKCKITGAELAACEIAGEVNAGDYTNCPYGQPGDRLWVRETWAAPHSEDARPPRAIQCDWMRIHYAATEERGGLLWRPSIHMPRWASRITLEITGVRVERLQDISEADAQAEGCSLECMTPTGDDSGSAIYGPGGYLALWESINGAGSWDVNPWVWAVDFKRIEGQEK